MDFFGIVRRINIIPAILLTRFTIYLLFGAILSLVQCTEAEPRSAFNALPPPLWRTDSSLHAMMPSYKALFERQVLQERIPGVAVVVVKGQEIVWQAALGTTDVNSREAVTNDTPFRLASLSKGFAPVLVGKLVEQGILEWDRPVVDYCANIPFVDSLSRTITLRHLLSQSSGFPHHTYSNLLNMDEPYERIRPLIAEVPLAHAPGTQYNYQNVIYAVSAEVVECATDRTYDELMEEMVLAPLGMSASSGSVIAAEQQTFAQPHGPDTNGYHRVPFTGKYYVASPAAGINASGSDMAKWLEALLGNRPDVLPPALAAEMFRIQIPFIGYEPSVKQWRPYEQAGYGFGWRVIEYGEGRKLVTHSGYVNGYRAELAFSPGDSLGICMLSNGSNYWFRRAAVRFFADYWQLKIGNQ